ncbi:MAG: DUF4157 domain-containing protein [Candidatus Sulfotelmatobacter sp.]
MERLAETHKQPKSGTAAHSHAPIASQQGTPLHPLLQLQQQAGNQAVQQLLRSGVIQAKLSISHPDDPEEREADNVAQTIMRAPAGFPAHAACSCAEGGQMCEECLQKQAQPAIHRRAATPSTPAQMPHIVSNVLHSPGHPLDAATRAFFEPRFGQDFGNVRVHTDSEAANSARSINALAYTAGEHLFFDSGQYAPTTNTGRHLLAHELTHAVQSRSTLFPLTEHSEPADQGNRRIFRNPAPSTSLTPSSAPVVLEDLIRQSPEGFTDSALDSAYQDYVRKNPSAHADPRNWALRQTAGAPRDRLQTLLGPNYAVGQRAGLAQPPVNVLQGGRPPDYSDPRLAKDIETLKEQPRIVLDRLQTLIATPVLNGQISQGHFSILRGNVAESLAQPQLQLQLQEVRRTEPDAQLFLGVRARGA